MSADGQLVKWEGLGQEGTLAVDDAALRLQQLLRQPGAIEFLIRCMEQFPALQARCGQLQETCSTLQQRCISFQETCSTLRQRCETLERVCTVMMCPASILYSQRTIDEYSDDGKVLLNQVVKDLGGDYVNAFPVPPGKIIRLTHRARPGFLPEKIGIDMNLAGGANNYLDMEIQFYLVPGGVSSGQGLPVGSLMSGNEFVQKDGSQIRPCFPEYRGCPHDIGSLDSLAVEIKNNAGANNLESAQVNIYYSNRLFYELCKKRCGCAPQATGACPTG